MSDAVVKALQKKASLSAYQPTFREKASDVLRALLFSDDREGQRKAEHLSTVLETVTPYGVATGIDDMREAVGQGDYATAGIMGAMAMVPGPSPKIKAYHGSPHSFDRFSMDKIGTGEGAQAYSHGLYLAEAEEVAGEYKKNVKDMAAIDKINARLSELAKVMDADSAGGYRKFKGDAGRNAAEEYDALMERRTQISNAPGFMYEAEIDADPNDFLDWDKPLSEQSEKVRQALKKLNINAGNMTVKDRVETLEAAMSGDPKLKHLLGRGGVNITGDTVYRGMSDSLGAIDWPVSADGATRKKYRTEAAKKASEALREAGIPGVRYLDAGSRSAGDGSRNYVVFDENLINIVRKYGIAGASAMLGYNLLDSVDPAQAKQLEQLEQVRKLDSIMGGAK